jgi:cob(I)alamin adenosyltransferase
MNTTRGTIVEEIGTGTVEVFPLAVDEATLTSLVTDIFNDWWEHIHFGVIVQGAARRAPPLRPVAGHARRPAVRPHDLLRIHPAARRRPLRRLPTQLATSPGQPVTSASGTRRVLMKIYTRKGDTGETSIWAGRRLRKDETRVEAIGSVDECNAAVGLALAGELPEQIAGMLASAQACLLIVGSELMAPQQAGPGAGVPRLTAADMTAVETAIDSLQAELPDLKNFILPGGTAAAARLHFARTVCRRAERRVTALRAAEEVAPVVPAYLNRLSDLLFVAARAANSAAGVPDVTWTSASRRQPGAPVTRKPEASGNGR